ncbi:hypothetical protein F0562_002995 [Nyssa sinensis]|uniref:NmrA-like domain-containing protein n=1 Tax=Nyssa sinensis TaxID=561372 RepID=A0A5J5BU92_9ASTE|nr:hypothetical protein F0562_002995 [Nyssa sinensis]
MGSEGKEKILIFGGSGYIGSYMVKASILMGHPTYIYSRPNSPNTHLLQQFQSMGVIVLKGELEEHEKLVSALRQVDVVISALAFPQVLDQFKIIDAIKVAGNIKRFLPSEFGCEEDRITALAPFQVLLDDKKKIRRALEASGIPYTLVSANCFGAYFVNYLLRPHNQQDDVIVYGSGEAKAVLNYEEDIAKYTIKVATDPRTCNRIVIYRPSKNIISQLELLSLWEKKTGRTFKRVHVSDQEMVTLSQTLPHPDNIPVSIVYSLFVKGILMSYELAEDDIEASTLYPDLHYTTIEQLLDIFLHNPPKPASAAFV